MADDSFVSCKKKKPNEFNFEILRMFCFFFRHMLMKAGKIFDITTATVMTPNAIVFVQLILYKTSIFDFRRAISGICLVWFDSIDARHFNLSHRNFIVVCLFVVLVRCGVWWLIAQCCVWCESSFGCACTSIARLIVRYKCVLRTSLSSWIVSVVHCVEWAMRRVLQRAYLR